MSRIPTPNSIEGTPGRAKTEIDFPQARALAA
jgi:hypothetical protein